MKKWPFARENHNLRDLRSPLVAANYLRNRQGMISSKQIRSIFPPVSPSRLWTVALSMLSQMAMVGVQEAKRQKGEKVPGCRGGGLCKEYLLLGVFFIFFLNFTRKLGKMKRFWLLLFVKWLETNKPAIVRRTHCKSHIVESPSD